MQVCVCPVQAGRTSGQLATLPEDKAQGPMCLWMWGLQIAQGREYGNVWEGGSLRSMLQVRIDFWGISTNMANALSGKPEYYDYMVWWTETEGPF